MAPPQWYVAAADPVARSVGSFRTWFGGGPDGVWAAPGRINLIGEHVDYNAGRCLPLALAQRTYCAVRRRDDGVLHVASGDGHPSWTGPVAELDRALVEGWARYVAGAVWAVRGAGADVPGLDVVVDSDVPIGAGLSSSAALICAVALAAAELSGWVDIDHPAARAALTAVCVEAETAYVRAPTGGMDQAAALRSRAGHALLLDCRDDSVVHVPIDLAASDLALLVIDTRVAHSHLHGGYGDRRRGCERAAKLLGARTLRDVADRTGEDVETALAELDDDGARALARHVLTEMRRVDAVAAALQGGRPDAIGPLLDASHRSLRDDFAVSCAELDLAVDASGRAGALGARMTGGGFGGSAIALVPTALAEDVAVAVDDAFAAAGCIRPAFLLAEPAGSATRIA